jgi:hypothetical protein
LRDLTNVGFVIDIEHGPEHLMLSLVQCAPGARQGLCCRESRQVLPKLWEDAGSIYRLSGSGCDLLSRSLHWMSGHPIGVHWRILDQG